MIDAAPAELQHLSELADTVQEVFWLINATNTEMLYVSPAYDRIFGRSRAALRRDIHDWINALHPDDRARMITFAATTDRAARQARFRIVRPDGAVRVLEIRVFPVCEGDRVVRIAGVTADITERDALEAQVRETQKLESLGLLAGGIAHDFNNILAIVAANASFLGESPGLEAVQREVLDEIARAVERGTALTHQLLAFGRKQLVSPEVVDLNAAVADTGKMLRRMLGDRVAISTALDPGLAHVEIDPSAIVQILMNLAVNARDAMPRGGALKIATHPLGHREVVLSVIDTGCGMTAEVKARAFEPLFTTKEVGRGTGLGLSVVHGIVKQAGGRIEIDSQPGVGTEVRIVLPARDADPAAGLPRPSPRLSGSERLVLVEDDPDVRCSISRALRVRGYDVMEASSGSTALELLGEHGRRIDLLVTDVEMPEMTGLELAAAARRARPSLRVLYISGQADGELAGASAERAGLAVLEKPFPGDALAARVRQILDEAKRPLRR
ncbi:MAG TPA: ATP-binding protein [Kofleriaceae bacterium]|nr:ATP-binding protein [Kofleriaceae bacterium]